jgi:hypothetical protein
MTERSPFLSAGWGRYQTRGLSFVNYDGSSLPREPIGARIGLGSAPSGEYPNNCVARACAPPQADFAKSGARSVVTVSLRMDQRVSTSPSSMDEEERAVSWKKIAGVQNLNAGVVR